MSDSEHMNDIPAHETGNVVGEFADGNSTHIQFFRHIIDEATRIRPLRNLLEDTLVGIEKALAESARRARTSSSLAQSSRTVTASSCSDRRETRQQLPDNVGTLIRRQTERLPHDRRDNRGLAKTQLPPKLTGRGLCELTSKPTATATTRGQAPRPDDINAV